MTSLQNGSISHAPTVENPSRWEARSPPPVPQNSANSFTATPQIRKRQHVGLVAVGPLQHRTSCCSGCYPSHFVLRVFCFAWTRWTGPRSTSDMPVHGPTCTAQTGTCFRLERVCDDALKSHSKRSPPTGTQQNRTRVPSAICSNACHFHGPSVAVATRDRSGDYCNAMYDAVVIADGKAKLIRPVWIVMTMM